MEWSLPKLIKNGVCQAQDELNAPCERTLSFPHVSAEEMETVDRMARSFDETGLDEINEIIDHNYYKDEDTPRMVKEHLKFSKDGTDIIFTFENTDLHVPEDQKVIPCLAPPLCCTSKYVSPELTQSAESNLIFPSVPLPEPVHSPGRQGYNSNKLYPISQLVEEKIQSERNMGYSGPFYHMGECYRSYQSQRCIQNMAQKQHPEVKSKIKREFNVDIGMDQMEMEGKNQKWSSNLVAIGRLGTESQFGPLREQKFCNGMVNGFGSGAKNLFDTPDGMGSPGHKETARRFFTESRYPSTESSSSGYSSKENIPKFQNSIPRVEKLKLTSEIGPRNREIPEVGPLRPLSVFSQSLPPNPMVNIDAAGKGPCAYCLSTGQRKVVAYSHSKFVCPILSSLRPCKICGASGLDNHTAMHCPHRQKVQLTLNKVQTKVFSERDLPFMKVLPKGMYNMPKWTSECC